MDGIWPLVALVLTIVTAVGTISLVCVKLAHRVILRGRGIRTARYIAVVGEMIIRRFIPRSVPRQWATDPLFHDALIEYRRLVKGAEREFLDEVVRRGGILHVLLRRGRGHLHPSRRLRAVASLVELAGREQIPYLRALLTDRNVYVRSHAAHGLARLSDPGAIPLILDLTVRVSLWEAGRLGDAMVSFGSPAVTPISAWVVANRDTREEDIHAVAQAVRVLGLIGDVTAEPLLVDLLRSPRRPLRLAAASALGRVATDRSRAPLLDALTDPSWEVRARAVRSLSALADASVAAPVAGLLTDARWWVRQNAAATLSEIPGGVAELIRALQSKDRFAVDAARNQLAELRLLPPGVSSALDPARENAASG
ncbi:MAG: HEAT repeat domain-containing protein [Actinomycetota bacterium]